MAMITIFNKEEFLENVDPNKVEDQCFWTKKSLIEFDGNYHRPQATFDKTTQTWSWEFILQKDW